MPNLNLCLVKTSQIRTKFDRSTVNFRPRAHCRLCLDRLLASASAAKRYRLLTSYKTSSLFSSSFVPFSGCDAAKRRDKERAWLRRSARLSVKLGFYDPDLTVGERERFKPICSRCQSPLRRFLRGFIVSCYPYVYDGEGVVRHIFALKDRVVYGGFSQVAAHVAVFYALVYRVF